MQARKTGSFLPTASFLHPLVNVKSTPNSREMIKQVYAVYKVLSKNVKIYFQSKQSLFVILLFYPLTSSPFLKG